MEKKRVLIVGAGASGLTAAVIAAREGAVVTILEHNEKPGKKINATGNGKCNLTNLEMPFDAFRGSEPDIAENILKQFSVQDTIRFFSELGIFTVNKNGYLYPRSAQASSVTDVLVMEARSLKVKIKTNEHVKSVYPEGEIWKVRTEGWTYEADAVIMANGSCASSISGADGSGYEMAKQLGHRVIKPLPALCALKCEGKHFASWSGVRTDGELTLCINEVPLKTVRGELQLTEYGVSGIPVFQISRYAIRALEEGCKVSLLINFLPEFSKDALTGYLDMRRKSCPYKNDRELLVGLFPEKLTKLFCTQKNLEDAVSAFPLNVKAGMSFEQAQVCSGGVSVEEVDKNTLESRLHKGLYFAGELLDIDGTCGGYNLQWAWSSGAVAGKNAAKE